MSINYEGLANLIQELGREGRPAAEGFLDYLRNDGRDGAVDLLEGLEQLRAIADEIQ